MDWNKDHIRETMLSLEAAALTSAREIYADYVSAARIDRSEPTENDERAQAERTAAEADIAAARLTREREIAQLTARISSAAAEAERIRSEVIPPAIKSVEQVREGFNRGGFQYLDVTEAERALAEARARRVSVLRQYHIDQAALDRLTGRHAGISPSTSTAERR